ncbi:hypothetical protein TNCV_5091011 [Trichonephila clavipes]|nr:hypothetical protein TNCV_5091011 [Trichonephila clavipes]
MTWISKNTSNMIFPLKRSWRNFCLHRDKGDFQVVDALLDCGSHKKHHFLPLVTIVPSTEGSLSTAKIKSPIIYIRIAFWSSFNMQGTMCLHTLCLAQYPLTYGLRYTNSAICATA